MKNEGPGRPVVKTLSSYCRKHGLIPGCRTKIPQAARCVHPPPRKKKIQKVQKAKLEFAKQQQIWASLVVQLVKNPPAMQETPV